MIEIVVGGPPARVVENQVTLISDPRNFLYVDL